MIREIVRIDEEKCNGCGQCVNACAEGALKMINGKAVLVSETYCDGLGACLGKCPQDAITIEKREANEFSEEAVQAHAHAGAAAGCPSASPSSHAGGCPGSAVRTMRHPAPVGSASSAEAVSALSHWPVQLRLVPPGAPFLKGADVLVCADCVPFAFAGFHEKYLRGRAVLVGCPKLDDLAYYADKLKHIIAAARPASLTVARMEVPCCAAIASAVIAARDAAAPELPVRVDMIGTDGELLASEVL
jgi:NAD-dependent dihydropyrimidine dehydrogenase PreA subunit